MVRPLTEDDRLRSISRCWGGIALGALMAAVVMVMAWQEPPAARSLTNILSRLSPASAHAATAKAATFQKIRESGGIVSADYGFVNFNNDSLTLSFSIATRELATYRSHYGYTRAERAAIDQWQKTALADAYEAAVKNRQSQEQLNRAGEKIAAEYRHRLESFYRSRGFTLIDNNLLLADIGGVVRRNVSETRPLALSLSDSGQKLGYDSDSVVTAALSFAQTAIRYENVPLEENGRHIGGIYPPLETLAVGKGDCDTKSTLLAAILLNWNRIRLVGVGVPGHYLLGILRHPAKGDAFVEYQGGRYVLMEPAGPAWLPPGNVARKTLALLGASDKIRIEPLTAN